MEDLPRHLEQQHSRERPRARRRVPDAVASTPNASTPNATTPNATTPAAEGRGRISRAVGEAVWAWDIATGHVARGGAYPELCGYAIHEIPPHIGWWRDQIHPDDRASVLAAFDEALSGERRELVLLYRLRHRDGSHVTILERGFVLGTGHDAERMIGFAHQIPSSSAFPDRGLPVRSEKVEEERHRIARELHDEVGQLLTALRILIRSGVEGRESAEEVIDELFSRVREISSGLRPPMLDELGLFTALHWHCSRFTERTGIQVHLIAPGLPHRYGGPVELTVFRLIQEALTNIARHAQTAEVWVTVRTDAAGLAGMVLDRGVGFDLNSPPSATSTGIAGMRARLREYGGRLTIASRPGQGTRVFFRLPLPQDPSAPTEVPR